MKTFTALWLAYKLKQKTIVVTHTTMLRDQWAAEIERLFGFKPSIIGSGAFSTDSPITVANVQTLSKHASGLYNKFGLVILDEAHHVPATTFTNTIDAFSARYRIALSGTLERSDGKHKLFPDFFGHKVFKPAKSNTLDPKVLLVNMGRSLPVGTTWTAKVTELLSDRAYIKFIAGIAASQVIEGQKVLIIGERVQFLKDAKAVLGERFAVVDSTTSLVERGRIEEKLESGELDGVCASRQIFSEGISINILNVLILTSPLASLPLLEQLIGRIQRKHPAKTKPPLVFDICFSGKTEKRQNALRYSLYATKGWDIISS